MPLQPSSRIIIVGSGVFGLSTGLWLARTGYQYITILDMQDTWTAAYDPAHIDSASADLNKIIRFSYGHEIEYQRLATEAAVHWDEWNGQVHEAVMSNADDLPETLKRGDTRLWWPAGMLRLSKGGELSAHERETLANMEREGLRDKQFQADRPEDVQRAKERGWAHKLNVRRPTEHTPDHSAVLDSTAGFVLASKSCAWAQFLARQAGVKFVLHSAQGKVVKVDNLDGRPVIETADGQTHTADLVIVAGGGWTPSLVPQAHTAGLLETTAGSVATIQLPKERVDLWDKFSPENCPVITWSDKSGADIYSLPRNEDGMVKIGYRATKYTNYEDVQGQRVSVPKTAHVTEKQETNIPLFALERIKEFILRNLPDLADLGITATKLCWYTDSIDNSFVVDYVPDLRGVAVCSGGSGHGFKFLPILGREIVRILQGNGAEAPYGQMWQWRHTKSAIRNGLEEGENGPRVLEKQVMASPKDWHSTM